jgi:alkanesulfonate monooxygenase SsuD/methylene tetrahydromethanopterin reductase-like flavin-dependent oxidoreductase (luciferase family)
VIGGLAPSTLRVVAEHADTWNFPGADIDVAVRRSALLDRLCTERGRDPAAVTRSMILRPSNEALQETCDMIKRALDAGFSHFVVSLPAPWPAGCARWLADEVIGRL